MKTAGRENPSRCVAITSGRAHGADGQNRSCSIKWAAQVENFQPREKCFFLTFPFIEQTRTTSSFRVKSQFAPCFGCQRLSSPSQLCRCLREAEIPKLLVQAEVWETGALTLPFLAAGFVWLGRRKLINPNETPSFVFECGVCLGVSILGTLGLFSVYSCSGWLYKLGS